MPDPFGRHEARFYDGSKWTPYVKDGDAHSLDEPIEEVNREGSDGPEILTADVLVVEQHVDLHERTEPYSVFGRDGRGLGTVRRSMGEEGRFEVLGGDGRVALTMAKASTDPQVHRRRARRVQRGDGPPGRAAPPRDGHVRPGVRRRRQRRLRAGPHLGGLGHPGRGRAQPTGRHGSRSRGRAWTARRSPPRTTTSSRIGRQMPDPQRALVYAAALAVDTLLKKDTRGFS